jgi:hypothetical protein
MDKSGCEHAEIVAYPDSHVGSYAVEDGDEQVTVIGTMGQDPDHKAPLTWRAWAIVLLCSLATFQVKDDLAFAWVFHTSTDQLM